MPAKPALPDYDRLLTGHRFCAICSVPVAVIMLGHRHERRNWGGVGADGQPRCKVHQGKRVKRGKAA